ncbi:hypothetical protein [Pseudomonas sp. TH10]|uniref:hypothetical protein n=1 Tax=Pseudomonas sp. TH10 TaxID=2796376 RepID=UPI001A9199F0|nr:hypothetical protein [Pseudomonas sp. TH10]
MINDVGTVMRAGSIIATGGVASVLSNGSMTASILSGYLKGDLPKAATSNALSTGFEHYAVSRGMSASDALKVSNAFGVAGVWDTLIDKASEVFKGN